MDTDYNSAAVYCTDIDDDDTDMESDTSPDTAFPNYEEERNSIRKYTTSYILDHTTVTNVVVSL